MVLAGIDIGGTKIIVTLADANSILIRVQQATRLTGSERTVPEQCLEMLDVALEKLSLQRGSITHVGVSTCSPFGRVDGKKVILAPNLCGGLAPERNILPNDWKQVPIEAVLTEVYPSVEIQNDCVSALIGENMFGAGQGETDLVYVTWSTGIGSGAMVDGNILQGKGGNAPHMGHLNMVEDGPECGCGTRGHLEALASGTSIALDYGEDVDTKIIFERYRDGKDKARMVVNEAAKQLGRGLSSLVCILDTKLIVIGGSVFLNNHDILLPLLQEQMEGSFPPMTDDVIITTAELGEHLGYMAALALVIEEDIEMHYRAAKPWEKAPETIFL